MRSLTDLAANLDISTEQVLTALRVVATRAGVDELVEWAAKELEGYEEDDELPAHRGWRLTIVSSLYNPWQGFIQGVHIPIAERFREEATTFYCRSGIGELERMLASPGQLSEPMGVEHPNLAQVVNASLQHPWTCARADATFSPAHLRTIVNRARQTALRLCLECEKKGIDLQYYGGEDDGASPQERKAWLETLKQEATKLTLREVWASVRDYFAAGIG